jgi:predicted transcriptional regulator
MDDTLRVFKAVANKKRVDMIRLLAEKGKMSLKEIAFLMDIPEATACRNLKILESAGLVKSTIIRAIAQYWLDRDMNELPNGMVVGIVLNGSTQKR